MRMRSFPPIMYFELFVNNNSQIILIPFWIEISFFKTNAQSALPSCPCSCSGVVATSAVGKPFKYCERYIYLFV